MKQQNFKVGDWALGRNGWKKLIIAGEPKKLYYGTYYISLTGKLFIDDEFVSVLSKENAALLGEYPPKEKRKVKLYHALVKSTRSVGYLTHIVCGSVFKNKEDALAFWGSDRFIKLLDDGSYPSVEIILDE